MGPDEQRERARRGVRDALLNATDDALVQSRSGGNLLLRHVKRAPPVDDLGGEIEVVPQRLKLSTSAPTFGFGFRVSVFQKVIGVRHDRSPHHRPHLTHPSDPPRHPGRHYVLRPNPRGARAGIFEPPASGVAVDPEDRCVTVTPQREAKAELERTAARLSPELGAADDDPMALKQSKEGVAEGAALTDGQIILDPPQDEP